MSRIKTYGLDRMEAAAQEMGYSCLAEAIEDGWGSAEIRELAMSFREKYSQMTIEEAIALNEAARRTCEFEATSQVGEFGG